MKQQAKQVRSRLARWMLRSNSFDSDSSKEKKQARWVQFLRKYMETPSDNGYGLVVFFVAVATLLRWWAKDILGSTSPFITYYAAIIMSASLAGWGPSLFATFSGLIGGYWFLSQNHQFIPQVEIVRLILYLGSAITIICFAGQLRYLKLQAMEREKQRQQLFDAMGEGFALLEMLYNQQGEIVDNRILEVNAAYERQTGLKNEQVIGRPFLELPPHESAWFRRHAELFSTGRSLSFEEYSPVLRKWFLINAYAQPRNRVGVTFLDITEQKQLTEEMARLDRLNLIGEMAAAIGHEVRNPMTTVRGYLQLFQKRPQMEQFSRQLSTMIEELDRANVIITEFLSLAKNKSVDLQMGSLNDLIQAIFPLLQADALLKGQDIVIETGDIPNFKFDSKELRQLIINLTRNGLEAMKNGGVLRLKTYCDNSTITLEVQDTGSGIPPEVLNHIGTPFLTTKTHGTGLGLPVCYQIAARHGAKIDVKTSAAGTTFIIEFNLHKTAIAEKC